MTTLALRAHTLADIPPAASGVLNFLTANGKKMVAFYGVMGAGKTTLIAAMLRQLGIEDHASSPTFSIVNEYWSPVSGKIYHFDFYRIKDPVEALDIGIEELFEEDAWCFIEWPEKLGNLLPERCVSVKITVTNGSRLIEAEL